MKKSLVILVMIIAVTSCGSFHRAHYRHVKMVRADYEPLDRSSTVLAFDNGAQPLTDTIKTDVHTVPEIIPVESGLVSSEVEQKDTMRSHWQHVQQIVLSETKLPLKKAHPSKGLRHDWSLLIATLLIISGVMLFVYIGVFLAAAPISLFVRILLSIILSSVAVRMLVEGISIYRNRFRSGENYKES